MNNTKYCKFSLDEENLLTQFIRGSLLGDGSLEKITGGSKNSRLTFGHSSKQLVYLQWKVNFLKKLELSSGNITKCESFSKRYKNGSCLSYHTKSFTHPIFTKYRNLYYPNDKRIVNKTDVLLIDAFALAIWFMDDGHAWHRKNKSTCLVLNTTSFMQSDVLFLIDLLKNKFDIISTFSYDNVIRISSKSSQKFLNLINPYLLDLFDYKRVLYKPGEFRGHPEVGNPEPSL
jgi:hypothetical protein